MTAKIFFHFAILLAMLTFPVLSIARWPGKKCDRICSCNNKLDRKICVFDFVVENYQTMGVACENCANGTIQDCYNSQCITADGFERSNLVINRQLPGPTIKVCQYDIIVVDVTNKGAGQGITIHWHGIHQKKTPWMDGVPYLTQCPIAYNSKFTYTFEASESGTHFYHAHSAFHKVNGLYGPLIVSKCCQKDPNCKANIYEHDEHIIFISDWLPFMSENLVPGSPTLLPFNSPVSLLINGRGIRMNATNGSIISKPPLSRFVVGQGKCYRFRVVGGTSDASLISLQVEKHKLIIIEADIQSVKPQTVDTIYINSGERYDFVLCAEQTPGIYLIRIAGFGFATFGYLVYKTNEELVEPELPGNILPEGISVNKPNANCSKLDEGICKSELTTVYHERPGSLKTYKDVFLSVRLHLMDNKKDIFTNNSIYYNWENLVDNLVFTASLNNISHQFPNFPILTQPHFLRRLDTICYDDEIPDYCRNKIPCPCTHIIRFPKGKRFNLILIDQVENISSLNHPFHIHGGSCYIMCMGQDPDGIPMTIEKAKKLHKQRNNNICGKYTNKNPPMVDTVSLPSKGFAVLNCDATNPGFWFLHCHYEFHSYMGMSAIIQIGDVRDMIPPPRGFPTCGNGLREISSNYFD